jgi:hypothetical protein
MEMFRLAVMAALITLPSPPAAWSTPCAAVGATGKLSLSGPSITLDSGDLGTPGQVYFHFYVSQYSSTNDITVSGPMLAVSLDSGPVFYTNLQARKSYGSFDLALTGLKPGKHSLGVGFPNKYDALSAYQRICFDVK